MPKTFTNSGKEFSPESMTVTVGVDSNGRVKFVNAPLKGGRWDRGLPPSQIGTIALLVSEARFTQKVKLPPGELDLNKVTTMVRLPHSFLYMDVGRWGGPAPASADAPRNFGIVCGREAALCDFAPSDPRLDTDEHLMRGGDETKGPPLQNAINTVIRGLRGSGGGRTVRLFKADQATTANFAKPIAANDKIVYVILPDFHLPIVDKTPPVTGTDGPTMARISYGGDDGEGRIGKPPDQRLGPSALTWFTRYLAGDIFGGASGSAAADLVTFIRRLEQITLPPGHEIHLVQVGDMYDLWIGLESFFDSPRENVFIGTRGGIKPEDFIDHWVDRTNQLFSPLMTAMYTARVARRRFLWGNHDNYLANPGGHDPQPRNFTVRTPPRERVVREDAIFIEHGQRGDPDNHDGEQFGHTVTNVVFRAASVREIDPNRRDYFTAGAALEFVRDPNFAVYVMGHTHSPFMTQLNIVVTFVK